MAHLSLKERETIESNLKHQKNFTQIGELIGKHRTTISN
jgi:IS30 family transposase